MAAWELPPTAWDTESVKVARCIIGTNRVELLDTVPLRDFQMNEHAGVYGPGKYRLSPGPGPYSAKSTTLEISEEYARRAGFGVAPPAPRMPSASEAMAAKTFQEAEQRGIGRVELMQMIETAVQKLQPPPQPVDPLALVMKGFELSNTFQSKSLELAKGMLGVQTEPAKAQGSGWPDVLLELAPALLDTLKTIVPAIVAQPRQPVPGQVQQVPTPQHQVAPPPARPTLPPPGEPMTPAPLPALSADEQQAIAPLVGILQPYGELLAAQVKTAPPEALAGSLAGMLGADLDPAIMALAAAVEKYGPTVLNAIDPKGRLATQEAAATVAALARIVSEGGEDSQLPDTD